MRFDQFVHRYTKGVFAFIIVVMVVPLVLWGYMGNSQEGDPEEEAGKIQTETGGPVGIGMSEFTQQRVRAVPAWWWKKYNDRMTMMMMMRFGRNPEPPKDADIEKQAWENIILLRDARDKGMVATEQETFVKVRKVYEMFTGQGTVDDGILDKIVRDLFHTTQPVFLAWAADQVMIDKMLDLVSDGEFADYDRVYDQVLRQDQHARVWYASFDPKDYSRETRPPTPDEILKHYEQNKAKFRSPEKVRVSYLMAEFEPLKKKAPEPTEDEIKKYYEENKGQFEKEDDHKHAPGEQHRPDEPKQYKPLDEVKADVASKIKQRTAEKEADKVMDRVNIELGAAAAANQGKYPEGILETLKEKFAKEGAELVFSNTAAFDRKHVDDLEKEIGTGSALATWPFDPAVKEGEIGQKVRTSKGTALFRLDGRKAGGDLGVTEVAREAIVKELQKEQLKKKTHARASNLAQEITAKGLAAVRAERALDWRVTRYFKTQGGETGIDDKNVAFAISQQVTGGKAKPGTASVLSGSSIGRDFADWAYVVYVEDLVGGVPEDSEDRFKESRRRENDAARRKYRDEYIVQAVQRGNAVPAKKSTSETPKTQ